MLTLAGLSTSFTSGLVHTLISQKYWKCGRMDLLFLSEAHHSGVSVEHLRQTRYRLRRKSVG
jgi:hypothetical protein